MCYKMKYKKIGKYSSSNASALKREDNKSKSIARSFKRSIGSKKKIK